MRFPRMTTRRWILAIFVIGLVIGGTIEIDRAWQRRSDYLAMALRSATAAEDARTRSIRFTAQAEAMRKWVADGSKGPPPGLGDFSGQTKAIFVFGRETAKALHNDPEKALAFASYLDCESENDRRRAEIRSRWNEWAERCAAFPRIFFVRDPELAEVEGREWFDRGVSLTEMRPPM